jgi:nitrile hydratase accessory protein
MRGSLILKPADAFAPGAKHPAFREPWEAQAFALAVSLHHKGVFTSAEWAAALGREIAQAAGTDSGEEYYLHWLTALETLVVAKGAADARLLQATRQAWDRAARATPHGQPIVLPFKNVTCA